MRKALIISAQPTAPSSVWGNFERLRKSLSAGSGWLAANSASEADIILFCDSNDLTFSDVRRTPEYVLHREKVFVYDSRDNPVAVIPGVYTALEKSRYRRQWQRSGSYAKVAEHDWIEPTPITGCEPFLCSFVGSFDTSPVRQRLAKIAAPDVFIRDTSSDPGRGSGQAPLIYREWKAEYAKSLKDSVFCLCPRGVAPSSYRIFEAMRAGRVPLIISDEWVPPDGPHWSEFSLRVAESDVASVPAVCRSKLSSAAEMGRLAREAFDEHFALPTLAVAILNDCLDIRHGLRGKYRRPQAFAVASGLANWSALRRLIASFRHRAPA